MGPALLFGSGGWLPTLSSLLINAFDIASKQAPTVSALLSSSQIEGVHASKSADYTSTFDLPTTGGQQNA